jgi:type IV pilus assembly protein PilV
MPTTHHSDGYAGFTLLEVLVALVVISFGLLGVAGMQLAAMRDTNGSNVKTIAAQQADDIADRMRANWAAEADGSYNNSAPPLADPGFACVGVAANCTPDNLAQFDLYQWNRRNALLLPNGYGVVCRTSTPDVGEPPAFLGGNGNPGCDNAANSPYVIKVWWDERRLDSNGKRFRLIAMSFKPF